MYTEGTFDMKSAVVLTIILIQYWNDKKYGYLVLKFYSSPSVANHAMCATSGIINTFSQNGILRKFTYIRVH